MDFNTLRKMVRDVLYDKIVHGMKANGFYIDKKTTPNGNLPHRVPEGNAALVLQELDLPSSEIRQLIDALDEFADSDNERWQREHAVQLSGAIRIALCCSEVREQLGVIRLPFIDLPKKGGIEALFSALKLFLLE